MYHPFTISETIKTAWDILKKNFVTVIIYSAITFTLLAIIRYGNEFLNTEDDFTAKCILFIVVMFIQAYTTLGLYKLTFTLIDSEYYEFNISQVLPKFTMIVSFIIIALLTGFFVVTTALLINYFLTPYKLALDIAEFLEGVLSLYLAVRFIFCICFVADDYSGPIESLKQSFNLTNGYFFKMLLLLLIIILLIGLGCVLPQQIGMILTYPLVNIILIVAYRKLVYSHKDVDDDVAETL